MASLIGQKLGQYEIVALLGEGGMAAVYRAHQSSMRRDVAIKVIKPGLVQMGDFVKRFEREAATVAGLSQSHILKVFDYGHQEDLVYLVMELLTGGSLSNRIRQTGQFPTDTASQVLDQLGSALDYAHRKGIIHRDLKPDNVLFDEDGETFLSDFGLAKMLGDSTLMTQSGMSVGTPAYMAPEQWQGLTVDSRVDLYALGVILFEMLSGKLPFVADTAFALMHKHVYEVPPSISEFRANLPIGVEQVLRKALSKDREHRFQSGRDMGVAFKSALAGLKLLDSDVVEILEIPPQSAPPPAAPTNTMPAINRTTQPLPTPAKTPAKRRSGLLIVGILALLAVIGALAVIIVAILFSKSDTPRLLTNTEVPVAVVPTMIPIPTQTAVPTQTPTDENAPQTTTAEALAQAQTRTMEVLQSASTIVAGTQTAIAVSLLQTPSSTFTPVPTLTLTSTDTAAPSATTTPSATLTATPTATMTFTATVVPTALTNLQTVTLHTITPDNADQIARLVQFDPKNTSSKAEIRSIWFSANGRLLAAGETDNSVQVWNTQGGSPVALNDHLGSVWSVAFSSTANTLLLATAGADKTIQMWDELSRKHLFSLQGHESDIWSLAFSPDGKLLASGSADKTIRLWDVASGQLKMRLEGHTSDVRSAVFSPDGKLLASGSTDKTIRLWDVASGQLKATLETPNEVQSVAFNPTGLLLISASKNSALQLWDVNTNQLKTTLEGHTGQIWSASFSPDGTLIGSGSADGTIRLWGVH